MRCATFFFCAGDVGGEDAQRKRTDYGDSNGERTG